MTSEADLGNWDRIASEQAKNAIFIWLVAGIIYNLVSGHFLSWSTALLIFPGIFIASFASMPAAFINSAKIKQVSAMRGTGLNKANALWLSFWSIWWLVDLAYAAILAIVAMIVIQKWIG